MELREIFTNARDFFVAHPEKWLQNHLYRQNLDTHEVLGVCLVGGIHMSILGEGQFIDDISNSHFDEMVAARNYLQKLLNIPDKVPEGYPGPASLQGWNDMCGRTVQDVIDLLELSLLTLELDEQNVIESQLLVDKEAVSV